MPYETSNTYETLRVERRGPVGWLVFDRPDAGNAMDARMMRELEAACPPIDALSRVSVRRPSDAAYTEAASPAGPAPTTTTS